LICILWNLWKCRNSKVFRHQDASNRHVSRHCRDDLLLWPYRYRGPTFP
ncbi:hypothetical protein BAE44_0025929, partial [Dichanthelium oligosanthes]